MIDIALPQTDTPYRVMASRSHGSPSRFIALHPLRFLQPFLKAAMRMTARTRGPPHAVRPGGLKALSVMAITVVPSQAAKVTLVMQFPVLGIT
jgi:hypothetical protein